MNIQAMAKTSWAVKRRRRQALIGAAYIAPSFILMSIFNVFPIFMSLYLAFCKYNMVGSPVWIGLTNFEKLASNKALRDALGVGHATAGVQPYLVGQQALWAAQQELQQEDLEKAEAAGFRSVWISDHYHPWTRRQGQSPFVWAVIGSSTYSASASA